MKRYLLIISAVLAVVCSCNYKAELDELGDRFDAISADAIQLRSRVEAMTALANAQAAALTINEITKSEAGISVVFSDGTKYLITDGGAAEVTATDNGDWWTFAFGDGSSINILKTFSISFDSEFIGLPATTEASFKYTLTGAGGSVHVVAKGDSRVQVLEVNEGTQEIKVKAGRKTGPAKIVVSAIRNSDNKIIEKVIPVEIAVRQNAPVTLDGAMSGYYGQSSADGLDNYYTQFWKGEVDEDNYFIGEAYSLLFDFYAPISELMALPAGTYECAEEPAVFTFTVGTEVLLREVLEEELWIYSMFYGITTVEELAEFLGYSAEDLDTYQYSSGAELYHQFEDETYEDFAITDGTVTVALEGDKYTVTMNLTADSSSWVFTYEGEIPVEDHQPKPQVWDSVSAECWGDFEYEGYSEWILTFGMSALPDDMIQVDLLAPADAIDELPEGLYTVSEEPGEFTIIPDYTYWWHYEMTWDSATEGTMEIKKNDDGTYTFIMDFYDFGYDEYWGIEYTGALEDPYAVKDSGFKHAELAQRHEQLSLVSAIRKSGVQNYYNAYKWHKAGYSEPHVPFVNHK